MNEVVSAPSCSCQETAKIASDDAKSKDVELGIPTSGTTDRAALTKSAGKTTPWRHAHFGGDVNRDAGGSLLYGTEMRVFPR